MRADKILVGFSVIVAVVGVVGAFTILIIALNHAH